MSAIPERDQYAPIVTDAQWQAGMTRAAEREYTNARNDGHTRDELLADSLECFELDGDRDQYALECAVIERVFAGKVAS